MKFHGVDHKGPVKLHLVQSLPIWEERRFVYVSPENSLYYGDTYGWKRLGNCMITDINPSVYDDITKGWNPSALWVNTDTQKGFICVANDENNAIWQEFFILTVTEDTITLDDLLMFQKSGNESDLFKIKLSDFLKMVFFHLGVYDGLYFTTPLSAYPPPETWDATTLDGGLFNTDIFLKIIDCGSFGMNFKLYFPNGGTFDTINEYYPPPETEFNRIFNGKTWNMGDPEYDINITRTIKCGTW